MRSSSKIRKTIGKLKVIWRKNLRMRKKKRRKGKKDEGKKHWTGEETGCKY